MANIWAAVPGIAVLAVLAAGVAFALYDNRVKLETRINTQVTLLQNSAASQIGRLLDQDELQQQVSTVVQKLRRDFRESPDPAVQRNSALALLRIAPAGDKLESELQHVVAEVLRGRAVRSRDPWGTAAARAAIQRAPSSLPWPACRGGARST